MVQVFFRLPSIFLSHLLYEKERKGKRNFIKFEMLYAVIKPLQQFQCSILNALKTRLLQIIVIM